MRKTRREHLRAALRWAWAVILTPIAGRAVAMGEAKNGGDKKLHTILKPREKHWVGDGFYVSTMFAVHQMDPRHISPFIMLDHAAPKAFGPTNKKLGVGEHPHRGFETVTFAIKGEIDHRDSGGGGGTITTGGVQWMTAGSGVVHEEFHSRRFAKTGGDMEMVQLWVNLPSKHKMTKPRYQSMNREDFPSFSHQGQSIKLIAGELAGKKGPAKTFTPINICEIFGQKDGPLTLDLAHGSTTIVIQLKGQSSVAGRPLAAGDTALMERAGRQLSLSVTKDSHILLLNGEPIDEPVVAYGPFVMNTRQEIVQAIEDFQAGKMGVLVEHDG